MKTNLYRLAREEDRERIITLLSKNNLPVSDLVDSKAQFIISVNNENLTGCIAIEQYEKDGLLRSLAVHPDYRNLGIGTQLLQRLLAYCLQLGIEDVHLLTTTAEKYFLSKGFLRVSRDEAPESIKKTPEFSAICPSSSAYMTLKQLSSRALLYTGEVKIPQTD
jgi:amino-acid N-acetyltransferase